MFDEEKANETAANVAWCSNPLVSGVGQAHFINGARWQYEQDKDLLDRAMKLLDDMLPSVECWEILCAARVQLDDRKELHRTMGARAKAAIEGANALLKEYRGEA